MAKQRQNKQDITCWECGKNGHFANECYSRSNNNNKRNGRGRQGNYASSSRESGERLFIMQHMMSACGKGDCADDVWYVDSGASNHMTHYKNWFHELHVLEQPGYVETGDDTVHQIQHVGNVPLATHDGQFKHMADVLHVPAITKNLVSIG